MFSTVLCFSIKENCLTEQSQVANSLDPEIQADHKAWPFFHITNFPHKQLEKIIIFCVYLEEFKDFFGARSYAKQQHFPETKNQP